LPFYVMERLNGQSLRVVLEKKGKLELGHALHIGIDLLDALDHAHDKGVVHRDVKPDNIFLHRAPAGVTVTKLLDFGIVSVLDGADTETAGRFLGTLRYAAPEQLRGEKTTPKSDLYSAALVLYEILTGRGPFDDQGDAHRIGAAHMHKTPPPVSRFTPVPGEVEALLMAALSKNPDERPRDAFSFAAILRNFKRLQTHIAQRAEEGTDGSPTAPAVVDPALSGVSQVEMRHPSPAGPYILSPVTSPVTPEGAPAPLRRTTVVGMVPPTVEGRATIRPPGPEALTPPDPDPIDRVAPTHGVALDDATRVPGGATDALTHSRASAAEPALSRARPQNPGMVLSAGDPALALAAGDPEPPASGAVAPLEWPAEREVVRSEGPQVRSLGPPVRSSPPRAAVAAAGLGVAGLLAIGVIAAVPARPHSQPPDTPGIAMHVLPAVLPASVVVPSARPVVVLPAPTIAPPALDDPLSPRSGPPGGATRPHASEGAAPPSPSLGPAATTVTAAPAATVTVLPKRPSAPRPPPSKATSAPLERPGPGF
jgi:serine/threonine-protein kinase